MTSPPKWRFISFVGVAALLGAGPPIVVYVADILIGPTTPKNVYLRFFDRWLDGILPFLWPTLILMGATQGVEHTTGARVVFLISMLANMVIYSVLGAMAWLLYVVGRRIPPLGG